MEHAEKTERVLIILERIEKTISNIYGSFAVNDAFAEATRRFWATMMEAELEHAALMRNIREKARHEEAADLEFNFDMDELRRSYRKVKSIEEKVAVRTISESRAYSIGAYIEESLFEFGYSKRLKSNDREVMDRIRRVENDTRQHYILLHNYSLDNKGPVR